MIPVFGIHAPAYEFRIAGKSAPQAFIDALTGWRVARSLSRPACCNLSLAGAESGLLDSLGLGTELELNGADGAGLFAGTVSTLRREKRPDGLRLLRIRAHDALERVRRRQSVVLRRPDTLAGVVRTALAGAGLSVDTDDEGPELPLILQWGTNDLDWLATLCASYGRYFVLAGQTVRLMSLEGWRDPAIELDPEENLFEVCIESSAARLRTEATACAWNPLRIESYRATAMDMTLEAVDDWAGAPEELRDVARDIVGGAGPQGDDVVSRVATADLERATKRAHVFSGLAEGDARIVPGTRIRLKSAGDGFAGEFAITRVEHAYEPDSGFTSSLSSEPPDDPERLAGPAVSLGVVSDTDDPDGTGRVKVLLKAFNDAESDWLCVCSLGAGESKGFVLQPEVGDNVLVAFANDNPAQGIVVGGLFGANALHDEDVGRNRPRPCSLRTRDGQQLRLDDQQGAIRLKSRGGLLDLDPDGVVLRAENDLQILAPGRRITIVADKIDFRKG